jgi:hypothetical protein
MRLLLALLLLLLQEPDRTDLVRQLSDPTPSVREKAYKALEAQGDAALPELKRALESGDAETRTRAAALIDLRVQEAKLAELRRAQRPGKLQLPEMSLEYDSPPGEMREDEGVRFEFKRRPWAPDGVVLGTIFETEAEEGPGVSIDWTVASIRGGKDLPVETCTYHSPELVYVPGEVPPTAEVRIRATRRWHYDVPMLLMYPTDGQSRRLGGFTVTVLWPVLHVRADRPLPLGAMNQLLGNSDVRCTIRPERRDQHMGGLSRYTSFSRCGVSRDIKKLAWCGCRVEPARHAPTPPAMSQETQARDALAQRYDIDAIESIALTLHLPVEEPFEATSPALKQ